LRFLGIPRGTPGLLPYIIGFAAPLVGILLIVLLAPAYAHTSAWQPIYLSIASAALLIGAPFMITGVIRIAQHRQAARRTSGR
jgi:uncharacterized membrane protein HdeD (DUF308 family)